VLIRSGAAVSGDPLGLPWSEAEKNLLTDIDTSVPVSARIWNYWMGGKDYYPIDKEAGDQFASVYPGIVDEARASRYFLARVVRFLAGEAGIRQFLDIGTGLPGPDNTHEIAQRTAPGSRIVYVDNDPLVLAHARALLTAGSSQGITDYIDADLNYPGEILDIAGTKLDFTQPIAIMLMGILGHIGDPDEDDDRVARSIVDRLKAALPSGGYLAIYDGADIDPDYVAGIEAYNQSGAIPYRVRSLAQITSFFEGLELVDPGVVPIHQWRPDPTPFPPKKVAHSGGVAKKP
jgi:S-adenosyl methyltransferase